LRSARSAPRRMSHCGVSTTRASAGVPFICSLYYQSLRKAVVGQAAFPHNTKSHARKKFLEDRSRASSGRWSPRSINPAPSRADISPSLGFFLPLTSCIQFLPCKRISMWKRRGGRGSSQQFSWPLLSPCCTARGCRQRSVPGTGSDCYADRRQNSRRLVRRPR